MDSAQHIRVMTKTTFSKSSISANRCLERDRQEEAEQHLHTGLGDPQLLQQLGVVAVEAGVQRLVSVIPRVAAAGFSVIASGCPT